MEKNFITESVKQYAADKYGISLDTIKSFDLSLVASFDSPDNIPDIITGIGFTIEEAFEDLMREDDFTVQVFEDPDSLKYYELSWNAYTENGWDILDGRFLFADIFSYLCHNYLKGRVKLGDIFAHSLKDFRYECGLASSAIPVSVFANADIEILEEV